MFLIVILVSFMIVFNKINYYCNINTFFVKALVYNEAIQIVYIISLTPK